MFKKQFVIGMSICIGVVLVVLIFWWLNVFYMWELKFYDYKFLFKGSVNPQNKIVIVGIDDKSIQQLGRWPWPRDILARGIRNLKKSGAKVIGIDIIFPEPSRGKERKNDYILAKALKDAGCVVGSSYFEEVLERVVSTDKQGQPIVKEEYNLRNILPIPIIEKAYKNIGFTNAFPDKDGVLRRAILKKEIDNKIIYSFNANIASNFLNKDIKQIVNNKNIIMANFKMSKTGEAFFPKYSFKMIYDGQFPKDWIKDKIVLIGSLATGVFDHYPTPTEKMFPGVEFHAVLVDNLIHNDYFHEIHPVIIFLIIILFGLFTGYFFVKFRPLKATILFFSILVIYFLFTQLAFTKFYLNIDFLKPSITIVGCYLGVMTYKFMTETKEKLWIKKTFSYYLSPEVINELMNNPDKLKLGGERKVLTVMFSDIRGFTSISEQLSPEQISNLLNEYLTVMTKIIFEYNGTVDKFIGDAIMAFWGAPIPQEDHAKKAVLCSIKMIEELLHLQQNWGKRNLPIIDIGIGINTGDMVVGNMGSIERMDYTVIGDNVNLASRLESLTRQYETKIIISEFTYEIVKDIVKTESLGEVKVKGKEKKVKIYSVIV